MSTNSPDYAGAFHRAHDAILYGEVNGVGVDRDTALDYAAIYLSYLQAVQVTHVPTEAVDALRLAVEQLEPPGADVELLQAALDTILTATFNLLSLAGVIPPPPPEEPE